MNDSLFSLDCCSSVVIERNDYGWRVWNRHSWKQRTAIVEAKRTERKEKECLESMLLLDHPFSRLDERKWSHQQRWICFRFPLKTTIARNPWRTFSDWRIHLTCRFLSSDSNLMRRVSPKFVPSVLIDENVVAWCSLRVPLTSLITEDTWASSSLKVDNCPSRPYWPAIHFSPLWLTVQLI